MSFAKRIQNAARSGRRDRYTKKEQLFIVAVSHGLLLTGVVIIMASTFTGRAHKDAPSVFVLTEVAIIAICLGALVEWPVGGSVINRYVPREVAKRLLGRFRAQRTGDAVRGLIVLVVSFAQFFALGALLHSTGGAIDSPFAQLALAIAIFTPFIANNWLMMLAIVGATMAFYVTLVLAYGFADPSAARPSSGAYIAINLMILLVATLLTLGELARGERMAAATTPSPPRLGDVLSSQDQSADVPDDAGTEDQSAG